MAEGVDVLFINPGDRKQIYQALSDEFPAIEPPVFAGLFATYLRRKGFTVAILDSPALEISAEEAAVKVTSDYSAKLIVIVCYGLQPSASTQNMTAAGETARIIKSISPNAKILMTGTHPSALPEQTMLEEAVDFVCDSEGPKTILNTLEAINSNQNDFRNIPSLWSRYDDKVVEPASIEPLIADLDNEMPGIAWNLLPMKKYRAHNWHSLCNITVHPVTHDTETRDVIKKGRGFEAKHAKLLEQMSQ